MIRTGNVSVGILRTGISIGHRAPTPVCAAWEIRDKKDRQHVIV